MPPVSGTVLPPLRSDTVRYPWLARAANACSSTVVGERPGGNEGVTELVSAPATHRQRPSPVPELYSRKELVQLPVGPLPTKLVKL